MNKKIENPDTKNKQKSPTVNWLTRRKKQLSKDRLLSPLCPKAKENLITSLLRTLTKYGCKSRGRIRIRIPILESFAIVLWSILICRLSKIF